jgi:glucose/arabinose dehydrogenase
MLLARVRLLQVALAVAVALALAGQTSTDARDSGVFDVGLDLVADGFDQPIQVVDPGDGSGRLFVVEQPGRIHIVRDGRVVPEPFLDITNLVGCCGERGLLSVAFHPDYANNGYVFVDYTDSNGGTVVARYRVSSTDPDRADPASAKTILFIDQPAANHNGGLLLFGPQDGYLYIGLGDGVAGTARMARI